MVAARKFHTIAIGVIGGDEYVENVELVSKVCALIKFHFLFQNF